MTYNSYDNVYQSLPINGKYFSLINSGTNNHGVSSSSSSSSSSSQNGISMSSHPILPPPIMTSSAFSEGNSLDLINSETMITPFSAVSLQGFQSIVETKSFNVGNTNNNTNNNKNGVHVAVGIQTQKTTENSIMQSLTTKTFHSNDINNHNNSATTPKQSHGHNILNITPPNNENDSSLANNGGNFHNIYNHNHNNTNVNKNNDNDHNADDDDNDNEIDTENEHDNNDCDLDDNDNNDNTNDNHDNDEDEDEDKDSENYVDNNTTNNENHDNSNTNDEVVTWNNVITEQQASIMQTKFIGNRNKITQQPNHNNKANILSRNMNHNGGGSYRQTLNPQIYNAYRLNNATNQQHSQALLSNAKSGKLPVVEIIETCYRKPTPTLLSSYKKQDRFDKKTSLYKTELCTNWTLTGSCQYENKCHFAHGIEDLKSRMRVENYKTQPCCDPAREGCRRLSRRARRARIAPAGR